MKKELGYNNVSFFFELYSRGDPHSGSILKIIKISKKLYKAWGWHDPH